MIEGILYEIRSSASQKVVLLISDDTFFINFEDTTLHQGDISSLAVSSRIGNVERKITLVDGAVFATKDNDAVDKLILNTKKNKSILHHLESNSILIFFALIFTIVIAFSFFKWGVPSLSKSIAHAMPYKVNELISENTLKVLDKHIFKPSQLSASKKDKIISVFKSKLLPLIGENDEFKYQLHFRLWRNKKEGIANAFALPNGDIILTDKFVQLSSNLDEISSVLLHEIGHVEEKHGLQRLIQSSFITVVIMFISGDSTALGDMGIGLGSLFLSSNYSRHHESQADLFAFKKMLKAKIDPISFANIMSEITETTPSKKTEKEKDIVYYLSSHPNTSSRINMAKQYSQCFKNGLVVCKNEK